MKFIEQVMALAYDAKVNFEDVFTQVRQWTVMIHNELMKSNIIGPHKRESYDTEEFEGAFVKEPKPGRYRWVAGFDLKGLYPHITWQCNISPEMIVEPENYTQAMKDVHRRAKNFLVTMEKDEAVSLQAKIDSGVLTGIDGVVVANEKSFDELIDLLKSLSIVDTPVFSAIKNPQKIELRKEK
jgi:hypothetical protein